MSTVDAYPLAWPVGWKRTTRFQRKPGAYKVPMSAARDDLLRSLKLLGARDLVVSSDVPTRRDGVLYSNYLEPDDPGVAVYWLQKGQPRVMACDAWRKVHHNVRAIGLAIDGLRAIERSGASQILERAFAGFAALPAEAGANGAPPWRDVFGVTAGEFTRDEIERMYRAAARLRHPDAGGTHDAMAELNRARDEALREIGS